MLEMAESASLGSGASNTHLVRPELGTTGTSDGQESPLTGSREKLLQDRVRASTTFPNKALDNLAEWMTLEDYNATNMHLLTNYNYYNLYFRSGRLI